ncbi:tyrosine-type recombinase/integrase [Carnimonas bestiolae]|uniref:tyrosine-type recombinase/integrase n=1 Tax=Carnimonas bestiolae TaxID=3402172 RepID=UPI003EDBC6C9
MHDVTFPQLLDQYFINHCLRQRTEDSYRGAVRVFRQYIGIDTLPAMVSQEQVLQWRVNVLKTHKNPDGITANSWNSYTTHLKSLFTFAMKKRLIPTRENPFSEVRVKPSQRKKKTVDPDAIILARQVMDQYAREEAELGIIGTVYPVWFWRIMFETFYYTGIRQNTLLHITASDVNLKQGMIRLRAEGSKSHRESYLPIPDKLAPFLWQLVSYAKTAGFRREDQLFNVNRFSRRHHKIKMTTWQVIGFYRHLSKKIGIRMSSHRFRHTLGTDLMASPHRDIHVTQQILNHTDIRTTLEYVHPVIADMKQLLDQPRIADQQSPDTLN